MSVLSEFLVLIGVKTELSLQQEREKEKRVEQRRLERSQLAAQVRYESDSADAENVLSDLRNQPETESFCRQIENYLSVARSKADAGDFVGAVEALRHVAEQRQKALTAAARATERARTTFAALFERADKIEKAAAQSGLLTADYLKGLGAELQAALKPLYQKSVTRQTAENVGTALTTIVETTEQTLTEQTRLQERAGFQKIQAEDLLKQLAEVASTRETAALRRELLLAETAAAEKDFAQAHALARGVIETAGKRLVEIEKERAAWEKLSEQLDPALAACREHLAGKCPVLAAAPPYAADLAAELNSLKKTAVGKDMSYADAAEALQRWLDQVELNRERIEAYEKLATYRNEADEAIAQAVRAVKDSLTKVEQVICKRMDKTNVAYFGAFQDRLEALRDEWQQAKRTALRESDLPNRRLLTDLEKLRDEIDPLWKEWGKHGDELFKISQQNDLRGVRTRYEQARDRCRAALDELEAFAAPALAGLEKRFNAVVERCQSLKQPELFDAQLKTLAEIQEGAEDAAAKIATATKKRKADARKEFTSLSGLLDHYTDTVERYKDSFLTESPEYEKYGQLLAGELVNIEGMLDSDDNDLLDAVVTDMQTLRTRLTQAINALERGDTDPEKPSFERLGKQIVSHGLLLKNENLSTYAPSVKEKLQDQLKDIKNGLLKTPMDESGQKLLNWLQRAREAIQQAGKARGDYESFVEKQEAVVEQLTDAKSSFDGCRDYYNSLAKQLAELLKSGKTEGGLSLAEAELERLKLEIETALKESEAMNQGQAAARKAVEQAENDETVWKAKYQDFKNKMLPRVKEAGAKTKLYNEVVQLGEMAQQAFEKSKDRATAEFQLNIARERAKWVIEFPEGSDLAGRNKLPEVEKKWQAAVRAFKEALATLVSTVEELEPSAKPELETALSRLGGLFSPTAFETVIAEIVKPGVPFETKQGKREEALAVVRRYKNYLVKDGRMKLLRENPFVKPFSALNGLYNALLDVEKNLLISL